MYTTFVKHDKDKSGSLDVRELLEVLRIEIPSAKEEDAKWFLKMVDSDRSNTVSFGEYVRGVAEFGKRGRRTSTREQRTFKWQEATVLLQFFEKCDKDRDGLLNFAELRVALGFLHPNLTASDASAFIRRFVKGVAATNLKVPIQTKAKIDTPSRSVDETSEIVATLDDKSKAQALRAFNLVDRDNSGTISPEELNELLKRLHPEITGPELNAIYHQVDANRSAKPVKRAAQSHTTVSDFNWEISYSELEIGAKLGEGTFGVVYRAKWRGLTVAVKELKSQAVSADIIEDFKKEIAILAQLRHPNVILLLGACTKPGHLAMVMEYLEGGSVFDVMHKRKKKLDLGKVLLLARQAALGMNYLHLQKPQVIHRDLKSLNFLVDENWNLKICDFGLAGLKSHPTEELTEQVGTPIWMAPELLLQQKYSEKVDVYSFAVCVYEMITCEVPFATLTFDQMVSQVGRGGKRPVTPPSIPNSLGQLIQECWQHKPASRPSFTEILNRLEKIGKEIL